MDHGRETLHGILATCLYRGTDSERQSLCGGQGSSHPGEARGRAAGVSAGRLWQRFVLWFWGRCDYYHKEAVYGGTTLWTDREDRLVRCERRAGHKGEHRITLRKIGRAHV